MFEIILAWLAAQPGWVVLFLLLVVAPVGFWIFCKLVVDPIMEIFNL